jgi:maleate cis-trans isomerase
LRDHGDFRGTRVRGGYVKRRMADPDRAWLDRLLPRLRYGVILPGTGGLQRGVDYQFYRLVPTDVMQIGVGLGIRDYSSEGVNAAMDAFWKCVQTLVDEGAQLIALSGVPVSAGLGRARILELMEEVPRRFGVPLHATLEAIVAALEFVGARGIAMGSRFPAETNAAIAVYLREAGIEVLNATARDISLAQARQLGMEDGMRLALEVGREAMRAASGAEALVLPGGATLSLHAIPALEAEFGKPTMVNLSAEIWSAVVRPGRIPPVEGWGCLLANEATVRLRG